MATITVDLNLNTNPTQDGTVQDATLIGTAAAPIVLSNSTSTSPFTSPEKDKEEEATPDLTSKENPDVNFESPVNPSPVPRVQVQEGGFSRRRRHRRTLKRKLTLDNAARSESPKLDRGETTAIGDSTGVWEVPWVDHAAASDRALCGRMRVRPWAAPSPMRASSFVGRLGRSPR